MSVDEALQRPGAVLWVETLPRKPRRGILSELAADFLFREECLEFLAFDMGERWDSVDVRVDVRVHVRVDVRVIWIHWIIQY